MSATGVYCEPLEEEPLTEEMLKFARQYAWGWLRHWNYRSGAPLNEQDLEDLLSEVLLAVLQFKIPEDATDWKPCLMGYLKQVTYRMYKRFRKHDFQEVSIEEFAPEYPFAESENAWASLECNETLQAIVSGLTRMPYHHALAFFLHLEPDLQAELLEVGGEAFLDFLAFVPDHPRIRRWQDREIAELLNLVPRAVIRARQHARERLQKSLREFWGK